MSSFGSQNKSGSSKVTPPAEDMWLRAKTTLDRPKTNEPTIEYSCGVKKICLKECLCNQQQLVCDECYNGDKLKISLIYFIPLN